MHAEEPETQALGDLLVTSSFVKLQQTSTHKLRDFLSTNSQGHNEAETESNFPSWDPSGVFSFIGAKNEFGALPGCAKLAARFSQPLTGWRIEAQRRSRCCWNRSIGSCVNLRLESWSNGVPYRFLNIWTATYSPSSH